MKYMKPNDVGQCWRDLDTSMRYKLISPCEEEVTLDEICESAVNEGLDLDAILDLWNEDKYKLIDMYLDNIDREIEHDRGIELANQVFGFPILDEDDDYDEDEED